jgi:hypothetical protein
MLERGFGLRYSAFFRVSAFASSSLELHAEWLQFVTAVALSFVCFWLGQVRNSDLDGWRRMVLSRYTPSLRQPDTFFLPQSGAMLTNLSVEWAFSQLDLFAPF